ncbi:TPA: hypothetical protein HMV87_22485 [Escherichia coli]|nr:hypothetical protein [Escherichia coli]HAJ5950822.1 hypothetical protein [Escherichia coli]
MGATKDWVMQVEESRREEWIRERLSSPDLEEDSEEWQLLEKDYDEYQDFLSDMAMEEYENEKWLKQHPHTEIYKIAINLLEQIKEEGKQSTSEVFIKMKIAHIVTIMENCLSEMIKSVVLSHNRYVENAIRNINELKAKNISLSELINKESNANKYVQEYLSDILYHRIQLVVEIYKAVLQPKQYPRFPLKNINELMKLRHDIVHRNGKTKTTDEKIHTFNTATLNDAFKVVEEFLNNMMNLISDAVEHHENEQIARDLEDEF